MKTKHNMVLALAVLLVLLSGCSTNPNAFEVICNIEGLEEGTPFQLLPGATHKREEAFARAVVSEGKLVFAGEISEPRLFYIMSEEENAFGSIPVVAEPGKIKVTAKATIHRSERRTQYNFSEATVLGSQAHLTYLEKTAPKKLLNAIYEENNEKAKDIRDAVGAARRQGDKKLEEELYQTEAWKANAKAEKDFFDLVSVTMSKMILDNADSWWGPFLMLDQMSFLTDQQKGWWEKFSPEARESYYGQIAQAELFPFGLIQKKAPEFSVTADDGQLLSLQDMIKGKKYTLIDFWASWCAPCRREIPNFKKAYETFAPKGFELIGISIDRNADEWRELLEAEKLPWPNYLDTHQIAELYKVRLVPTTYLVDENGIIIAENLKGEALMEKLHELLN